MCNCNCNFIDDAVVIEVRTGGEYVVKPESTGVLCYVRDVEDFMNDIKVGDVITLEEVPVSYDNG